MSVIIRLARPGEERLLAEVHTAAAYNSPNKVSNAFFRPNFKDQLEQYAEFKTLSYARHIKKEQVVCAIVDEKIVGLAAWNLPIKSTTDEVIEVETEAVAKREKGKRISLSLPLRVLNLLYIDRLGGVDSYRQSISDSECLPRTNKYASPLQIPFLAHLARTDIFQCICCVMDSWFIQIIRVKGKS